MKRFLWCSFFLVYVLITLPGLHSHNAIISNDYKNNSNSILIKCSDYCERLEKAALFFVCQERIEEFIYFYSYNPRFRNYRIIVNVPQKIEKNTYLYDYQLIKKGRKFEEKRILLEENGEKKHQENAELKTKRFYSKRSVFGPIGLLNKDSQELYDYEILKVDNLKEKKTYVIEIKPKKKMANRPNYGKAWIDTKDSGVLKIETEKESLVGFEKLKEESEKRGYTPVLKAVHYFEIEKNGIRFPSRTVFEEDYIGPKIKGRIKKSRTVITYDNYRFFIVEVKVKY